MIMDYNDKLENIVSSYIYIFLEQKKREEKRKEEEANPLISPKILVVFRFSTLFICFREFHPQIIKFM